MDDRHYLLDPEDGDEVMVLSLEEGAHLLRRGAVWACGRCTPIAGPNAVVLHADWRATA